VQLGVVDSDRRIIGARPPRRTFHGHKGGFTTIQSAVNAAKSGDWILVAPGDYKETPTSPARRRRSTTGISGVC